MLHVRAGVPRQGDPHHGRPGPGDRRALHCLRELRPRLLAERQAAPQHGARSAGLARVGRRAWPPAWPRVFPPNSSTWTTRRWSACCGNWVSAWSSRWPSAPTSWPAATGSSCCRATGTAISPRPAPRSSTFVERYYPELVPLLAPIVSPMIATARALRDIYDEDLKIVFIGPCIAKKMEAESESVAGEIDAAITFSELRQLFAAAGIDPAHVEPQRLRPAAGLRRRPVSHQPRRAPGGQPPRRPAHRRDRGHAGPQPRAGGDQGVCRRRSRRQAAGTALLRGLHHGRGLDQRPAHVQSPPAGADLRQRAHEDLRPRALAARHGGNVPAGPEPHLPGQRPADPRAGPHRGRRDHAPHGKAASRPTN